METSSLKGIFISFNQAYYELILELFDSLSIRGFTAWEELQGRGSHRGDPHYGNHAWPVLNSAIFVVLPASKAPELLEALHQMDQRTEDQGLRAFEWDITRSI